MKLAKSVSARGLRFSNNLFHSGSRAVQLLVGLCIVYATGGSLRATEFDFPQVDPAYTIRVQATNFASIERAGYDVLAFDGGCTIEQGKFKASATEIVLWIERDRKFSVDHPGKIICLLNGSVIASFGTGQELRDHRWMGRLFSVHPVDIKFDHRVQRYDIPTLDWSREPGPVQLAQFMQVDQPSGAVLTAPPLLGAQSGPSANPARGRGNRNPSRGEIPAMPGAIEWSPTGSGTASSPTNRSSSAVGSQVIGAPQVGAPQDFLPPGGLVIPQDGSAPYPAAGVPEAIPAPAELAPSFPSAELPGSQLPGPQVARQVPTSPPLAAKSVQFLPRGQSPPEITFPYNGASGETVGQIRGGFKLIVQGIQVAGSDGTITEYGSVSLEADNAVVWMRTDGPINLLDGFTSTADRPIELYLEGNIVFYQGNRVIYADRMYYNVSSEYGMVLSAEVLTPVPQYQGLLRLKADVLQQKDAQTFKAFGAAITSSRLGVPRYWMQAGEVEFEDRRQESDLSVFAPTAANRATEMRATAKSNHIYVAGIPVFFWPTFSTNLKESSFYLSSVKFKNDDIFGFQAYTEWDAYQLLGIQGPEGTNLRVSADYLSDRGPGFGSRFDYNRPTWLFGVPGIGYSDTWFLRDDGRDFIGSDRSNLLPEEDFRGRSISQHRLFLSPNWELMLETGWISDRNFLEQFFENEWEQQKDSTTAARLQRYNGNRMFALYGQARLNDFFTETEWLPRIDHYWLGQDLVNERLTWSAHTSVGYGHQKVATTPQDPADAAKFTLLPWETDSEGLRATTRQELSMPVSLGAWKLVPFLSGEAAFWNEDVTQDDVTRLTGQAGIRTSIPFWKVYPNVENRLFDLRGIAHKVTLESEFFYADSNQDMNRLPLYDPLDDNAQEHYRRRFIFNTFGGTLPPQFDESNFAFRSGMQRWITAGSSEIVDDLTQVRFGINQRWQTKRGLPGSERIIDLVEFDVDFIVFPRAQRDNFGEDVGAVNYDFRYHVGDRLTLLSDGYFDVFSQGLKAISAGAQMSRPGRGDAYIGFLSLEGPISANILNGYVNYRMNEKWIFNGGAAFDFGQTGSIGQSLGLTRIGESALIKVGVNVDHGRDNVSFNFNIEPRFLPTVRLGALGGELVSPAGLFGIE